MNAIKRITKYLNILSLYVPIITIAIFGSFILRIWISTGNEPGFGAPDPKGFNYFTHMKIIDFSFELFIYSIISSVVLFALARITKSYSIERVHLIFFGIGILLNFVLLFIDPRGYIEWYLD